MAGFGANKAIITLRPGFGPLQATVLHQLKGERHIMNLQVKKKPPYCDTLKYKERHALEKKVISPNWTVDGPKAVISEIHTQALDIKGRLHITPLIRFLCRGRLQMHSGTTWMKLAQAGPAGSDPGEQPVLWADCQHHPLSMTLNTAHQGGFHTEAR